MIKEILLIGNPLLREKSKAIVVFEDELKDFLNDLKDTITDFQKRKKSVAE